MQQREPRLGDILDDYCPRERRITNHAVVAMVESAIKQTRCTTCDAEHPYKGGRLPPQRRKKNATASLYEQVLTSVTVAEGGAGEPPTLIASAPSAPSRPQSAAPEPAAAPQAGSEARADEAPAGQVTEEEVRVHRQLIRATLPRVEGQPSARPVPEFTVRRPASRHGRFEGRVGGGGRHQDQQKGRGPSSHGTGMRGPSPRPGSQRTSRPGHPSHHPAGPRPVQHPHPSRRPPGQDRTGKKHSR